MSPSLQTSKYPNPNMYTWLIGGVHSTQTVRNVHQLNNFSRICYEKSSHQTSCGVQSIQLLQDLCVHVQSKTTMVVLSECFSDTWMAFWDAASFFRGRPLKSLGGKSVRGGSLGAKFGPMGTTHKPSWWCTMTVFQTFGFTLCF